MATASASVTRPKTSDAWGKVTEWFWKVFEFNSDGVSWPRGVLFLDVALIPMIVIWATGYEQYLFSALFGLWFAAVVDPGGPYGRRVTSLAVFGVIGAGITALGLEMGRLAWGWMVLVAFGVTLLAGLALRLGVHSLVSALILNIWFIIALVLGYTFHQHAHITSYIWAQVSAWSGGTALWIAVTFLGWLIHGRADRPPVFPELPGDMSPRKLTAPQIAFFIIRALAIAGAVAIGFGLGWSHGYWVPVATVVAMKPSFEQSTIIGAQRLVGALLGAGAAMLVLLIPVHATGLKLFSIDRGLELVVVVILMHAIVIRFWNYAVSFAAISCGVLIISDLGQPNHYENEGDRILWTLLGIGIAVVVMLLAGLLAKLRTKSSPQPTPRPAKQPA